MNLEGLFARYQALRSLRHRDFRYLMAASTIGAFVMPLQFLTQIFWVQDQYPAHRVVFIGLLAASRGGAMLLFSFAGGLIADRFQRRRIIFACESTALGISVLIAVLMLTRPFGDATVAALLVLTFFAAGNQAIDIPARGASVPSMVGMDDVANGISLQMVAQQLTIPLALPLAGILNGAFEAGQVYLGTLVAWAFVLPLLLSLRYHSTGEAGRDRGIFGNIRDGVTYTWKDATILGVIALVFAMHVIGLPGPAALGPVWMTEVLGLSKREFGFMAMTWGIGAMAGSFFFAFRPSLAGRGRTLCANVFAFAVADIVFGHSRSIPLTAVANMAIGFTMVGTMVAATTIIQHSVHDEMRGRVLGLFPLAMGLSMLNAAPVSVLGQAFGLAVVVPLLSWVTLLLAVGIIWGRPALRSANPATMAAPALVGGE
jgi:MFS family permease